MSNNDLKEQPITIKPLGKGKYKVSYPYRARRDGNGYTLWPNESDGTDDLGLFRLGSIAVYGYGKQRTLNKAKRKAQRKQNKHEKPLRRAKNAEDGTITLKTKV